MARSQSWVAGTTTTWTPEADVTSITVECWGPGGAGGGSNNTTTGGSGGGGGAFARRVFASPSGSHNLVVGAGGTGVSAAKGNDGSAKTYFKSNDANGCVADFGLGGGVTGSTVGAGGLVNNSVGTDRYAGGSGFAGVAAGGQGGGGSAGTGGNGTTATDINGATAVTGGGPGGNGNTSTTNGSAGYAPASGSGGGGGGSNDVNPATGGAGFAGKIVIKATFTVTTTAGSFGLTSSNAVLAKRLRTSAGSFGLTTSNALLSKSAAATQMTTTAGSFGLTSAVTPMRYAYVISNRAISASLTASNARTRIHPRTTASSFGLTAASAVLSKGSLKQMTTTASAVSLSAANAVALKAIALKVPTATSVNLTCSDAIPRRNRSLITTPISISLTASNAAMTKGRIVALVTTAIAANFTSTDAIPRRGRSPPTMAGSFSLNASNALLTKGGVVNIATTAGSVSLNSEVTPLRFAYQIYSSSSFSLTASDAGMRRGRRIITQAGNFSLNAANATVTVTGKGVTALTTTASSAALNASNGLLAKSGVTQLTTSASAFALNAANAVLTKYTPGQVNLTTTAASFSLTAENVDRRFAYQIYSAMSVSLTASSATLNAGKIVLTTVPSSVSLTIEIARWEPWVSHTGWTYLHTSAASFSLTTEVCKSRYIYALHSAIRASLTTSTLSLSIFNNVTTFLTYAPAIAGSLAATNAVLSRTSSNVHLTTTASSASLTLNTANGALAQSRLTYAPAISASLTASSGVATSAPMKIGYTVASSARLNSTPSPMTKTNSGTPTTKLLTTIAASFDFSASYAKLYPVDLATVESSFSFTASDTGVSVIQGPTPHGYYLTTVSSDAMLTSSTAAIFFSQRFLLTDASSGSLTASDSLILRNRSLPTLPISASLTAENARATGWWTLRTLPMSVTLSTTLAQRGFMRGAKGHRDRGRKHRLGSVSDAHLNGVHSRLGSTSDQTGRVTRAPLGKVTSE